MLENELMLPIVTSGAVPENGSHGDADGPSAPLVRRIMRVADDLRDPALTADAVDRALEAMRQALMDTTSDVRDVGGSTSVQAHVPDLTAERDAFRESVLVEAAGADHDNTPPERSTDYVEGWIWGRVELREAIRALVAVSCPDVEEASEDDDLVPCPFCSRTPRMAQEVDAYVECGCGAMGPCFVRDEHPDAEQRARAAWNRRSFKPPVSLPANDAVMHGAHATADPTAHADLDRPVLATRIIEILTPSRQEIRLHAGEMSAQEMRTTLAVLGWMRGRVASELKVDLDASVPAHDETRPVPKRQA